MGEDIISLGRKRQEMFLNRFDIPMAFEVIINAFLCEMYRNVEAKVYTQEDLIESNCPIQLLSSAGNKQTPDNIIIIGSVEDDCVGKVVECKSNSKSPKTIYTLDKYSDCELITSTGVPIEVESIEVVYPKMPKKILKCVRSLDHSTSALELIQGSDVDSYAKIKMKRLLKVYLDRVYN